MRALVGLGNPGPEYELTRHNVGFLALDEAAAMLGVNQWKRQFKGLLAEARLQGERFILFKPMEYMNLSGAPLTELMHWYKLEPPDIMVFSDDIDLQIGAMRIRMFGGAGTHKGWQSIIRLTGSQDFPRARIGVGAPPADWDLKDWVLSRWDKQEEAGAVREAITLAAKAGVHFLMHGISETMNRYNTKSRPPKPASEPGETDAP